MPARVRSKYLRNERCVIAEPVCVRVRVCVLEPGKSCHCIVNLHWFRPLLRFDRKTFYLFYCEVLVPRKERQGKCERITSVSVSPYEICMKSFLRLLDVLIL
jgi:hypothetical protein